MAPAISSSLASILVLFFAIQPFTTHSRSLNSTDPTLTSFQSLEGIKEVKRYLKTFGYLDCKALIDDKFDETLKAALESYQKFYNLKVTGKLDADTVKLISTPRCGVPDFVCPRHAERNGTGPSEFYTVPHYRFQPGTPKWPPPQRHLIYAFVLGPWYIPGELWKGAFQRAFQRWSHVSVFTFREALAGEWPDITIGFYSGDHGDAYPFDGPGIHLAHSFGPTNGRSHYNADQQWSINPGLTQIDLESVALHEIGHLLGLDHARHQNAVMYPFLPRGATRRALHRDDIEGIRFLYR